MSVTVSFMDFEYEEDGPAYRKLKKIVKAIAKRHLPKDRHTTIEIIDTWDGGYLDGNDITDFEIALFLDDDYIDDFVNEHLENFRRGISEATMMISDGGDTDVVCGVSVRSVTEAEEEEECDP